MIDMNIRFSLSSKPNDFSKSRFLSFIFINCHFWEMMSLSKNELLFCFQAYQVCCNAGGLNKKPRSIYVFKVLHFDCAQPLMHDPTRKEIFANHQGLLNEDLA